MESFRNIDIVGHLGSTQALDTIRWLKKSLIDHHLHMTPEGTIAEVLPGHGLQTYSRKIMGEIYDLAVVVGGDDGMLDTARALARHRVPVLGTDCGSLGFLTDIRPDELGVKIGEMLDDQYIVENRFLLDTRVRRSIDSMGQSDVSGDAVLYLGKPTRMIESELYIDDQFVCSQKADGLIVATPTGSAAYALSVGGPIIHPKLNTIIIVPMYSHVLSNRLIVVGGSNELKIVVSPNMQIYLQVPCGGQNHFTCAPGDAVTVSKRPQKLRLIHPIDHSYCEIYRAKFGWGSRLSRGG